MYIEVLKDGGSRPRWEPGETPGVVALLKAQIQAKMQEVQSLKIALEAVQGQCEHEGWEWYRSRQVGTCSICGCEFMTKRGVDEIFSG